MKISDYIGLWVIAAIIAAAFGFMGYCVIYVVQGFGAGSYHYEKEEITLEVMEKHCPMFLRTAGVKVLDLRHEEAMQGGMSTIEFEIPAARLGELFVDGSPLAGMELTEGPELDERPLRSFWNRKTENVSGHRPPLTGSLYSVKSSVSIWVDRRKAERYLVTYTMSSG
jgi:hypothetical protein